MRKHKDSGMRCAVAHYKDGILQPGCMECSLCNEYIPYGEYDGECDFDPKQNWESCNHIWQARSWTNPKFIKNATQDERCKTCHAHRINLPALERNVHPVDLDWKIYSPDTDIYSIRKYDDE